MRDNLSQSRPGASSVALAVDWGWQEWKVQRGGSNDRAGGDEGFFGWTGGR